MHRIDKNRKEKKMNDRRVQIWIALVAGLSLVVLLLLASSATARLSPPVTSATQPHAAAASGWSSGWVSISQGETITLTHNLGGDVDDYAVELWFRDTDAGGIGVNTFAYGGFENAGVWQGAYWSNLTDAMINVHRFTNDETADYIRLRIWTLDGPDYDSNWQPMAQGGALTLTHSLGGDSEDYTTNLWFKAPLVYGINNRYFGSVEIEGGGSGAHWQELNNTTIKVIRWASDTVASDIRVRIVKDPPVPVYDSGWRDIAAGELVTLTHDVGLNIGASRIGLQWRDTSALPTSFGQNVLWAGGEEVGDQFFGGHWQNLNGSTIEVYRQSGGGRSAQIRVRIWSPEYKVYLPLVLNNYAPEVELAYDDGIFESSQSWDPGPGNGFAVLFTTPGASARLVGARYYFIAPVAAIEVHVWDANRNDLITPFTATPSGDGWFDVDLSSHNLTVSGDFYVGFLYTVDVDPTLGVDTSGPDGRSYEVPWIQQMGGDYGIRAVVVSQ